MAKIHQLSPSLVNKIAAGEVIERPASVVKELLENSLDAGATRIDVSVVKGGSELIRITDNGSGIDAEDLPLAVTSHATSKLAGVDDLFRIGTLGFRGEALASIAEISRITLRSRPPESGAGMQIEVLGGRATPVEPCGCPIGTTIEVADLFFNTPVRRKFLRSTQTEMGHISEAVARVALAYPQVHFTLRHNDREVHDLPPADPWSDRIERLFGDGLASQLIWVESRDEQIRLWGYVAHPGESRGNQRSQYLFLNGRYIRDRSLQHALSEAYRGLLLTGRYPISFLRFDMPPELVDVNVHPTKLEVRFQDGGRLYSQLLSTLRTKFLTTDLTTQLQSVKAAAAGGHQHELAERAAQAVHARQEMVDWAKQQTGQWQARPVASDASPSPFSPVAFPGSSSSVLAAGPSAAGLEVTRLSRSWSPVGEDEGNEPDWGGHPSTATPTPAGFLAQVGHGQSAPPVESDGLVLSALQIHNRYLVAETDDGVAVIDQHALHERVLYEQLCEKVESGQLESQSLLVPEPVDLNSAEAGLVLEHRELLAKLGITVEPFGGDTVLVASYPAMLANIRPAEILRGVVDQLATSGRTPDRRGLLQDLLHSVACKAAIKAGDRLTPAEITALLEQRRKFPNTHHCPHGRPTELIFTREDLDKQFKRT